MSDFTCISVLKKSQKLFHSAHMQAQAVKGERITVSDFLESLVKNQKKNKNGR